MGDLAHGNSFSLLPQPIDPGGRGRWLQRGWIPLPACSWSCAQTREATTPWRSTSLQILDWPTGIMADDGRCSHETWGKPLEPPEVPEDLDMGDCMRPFLYQREEEQEVLESV